MNRCAVYLALLSLTLLLGGRPADAASVLQSAAGGRVHALVVGIDDYVSVLPRLTGSVPDATDIASTLRTNGVTDLRVLTDREATREAFLSELEGLLDRAKPDDLVIISYSGHGATVPAYPQFKDAEAGGRTEEFVMVDYDSSGPATAEVIADKEMKAYLSRFDRKGVYVLFIADSCFGGGMVRGLPDPRAAPPVLRIARNAAPVGPSDFLPIPMTPQEMTVDVSTLSHVTVLSGADKFTPVPEVEIPSQPTRRGALSYAIARALDGNAVTPGTEVTTRRSLFAYAKQEVQQYSDDQRIDNTPSSTVAMLDRPVFRFATTVATVASYAPPPSSSSDAIKVKVAVLGDDAEAKAALAKAGGAVEVVDEPARSNLIWDVGAKQAIQSSGDVIASQIGPNEIGGVIQRTSAILRLQALTETRPQTFTLRAGVHRYTPDDEPVLEAADVHDRYLIVFNLAADGRLQVIWPPSREQSASTRWTWTGRPPVVAPFGADYAIAVTSADQRPDFLGWLNDHDNTLPSVADELYARLAAIHAEDPTSRIGGVSLYTSAR